LTGVGRSLCRAGLCGVDHPLVGGSQRRTSERARATEYWPGLHHRRSRPSYLRVHSLRATSWQLLVLVGHGGPLPGGVLADAQHVPHGRCQAGTATQIPRDPGQPLRRGHPG